MTTGTHGLSYEGAAPKTIRVSYQIKYHELMDKIYVITGYEKHQVKIKIICRYPSTYKDYIPLLVEDHDTLSIVLDVAKQPRIHCLKFYWEITSIASDQQGFCSGSFT